MADADLEGLAGKVTEPQRKALLRHGSRQEWGGRMDVPCLPMWSGCGHVLREFRLIDFVDAVSSDTRLTDAGLSVRTYLMDRAASHKETDDGR